MARAIIRTTRTTKPAPSGRKPGRRASVPGKPAAKARSPKTESPPRKPAISKDELRAQVEKLEHVNATLRARSREANRGAKTAAGRIAQLEDAVAQLEKQVTAPPPAARRAHPRGATSSRTRRNEQDRDPGDAVPPGVAVEAPDPLDEEAEEARENLQHHLAGE